MRHTAVFVVLLSSACSFHSGPANGGPAADGGSGPPPTAVIESTPDYVGLRTTLDGSRSSDPAGGLVTFAWHMVSAPAGSSVTGDGSGSSFTFVADRGGDYVVSLAVTGPTGAVGNSSATVTVPTLPLFYRQATIGRPADSFVFSLVRSDGTGSRALSCPVSIPDGSSTDAVNNQTNYGDHPEGVGTRVWYGSGSPLALFEEAAVGATRLLATDEHGDCKAAPPRRLDGDDSAQHLMPRFSPDGTRVVWLDVGSSSTLVMTAGVDGSARHQVRRAASVQREPPLWLDATHVAWLESSGSAQVPHLTLASALDADGAGDGSGRGVVIDCDRAKDPASLGVINQIEQVGGSWIVAGGVHGRFDKPAGAIQIYRLAGTSCSTSGATVLASAAAGGFAWDFAATPDGSTLALAAQEESGSLDNDLFLVLVDGSLPPSRFVGSAPGLDDVGPMWIAGGRQLVWSQLDGAAQAGGLMIANRDGSGVRVLVAPTASGTANTLVGGAGNRGLDCSAAGSGRGAADLVLLGMALALAVRRRARGSG